MGGLPKSVAGTTVIKGQKLRAADLRPGELHLVVFGPGSSEGIVVVLPDGDVGVVDGVGGDVIPMLLDELGIATMPATKAPLTSATGAKRLLFACLTHPHKDHYPGFAELIGTRQPQNLWWAGDEELAFFRAWCRAMKLIEGKRSHAGPKPPGWREVEDIQLAIENSFTRRPATRHRVLADRKRLLSVGEVSIDSVLPTTSEKREALKRLVGIDDLETAHRNSEAVNDLSGALIVKWGTTQLLLGGDCNTGSESDHGGWAGHGETLGEVQVVKVPHHGSHSSWHPESWADWKPAIGLLTPYQRNGLTQPPTAEDIQRMRAVCGKLYISTPKIWQLENEGFDDARPVAADCSSAVRVSVDNCGNILTISLHGDAREII